jgi:hypothetical protein
VTSHASPALKRDPAYDRLWTQYRIDRIRKRRAREKEFQSIRKEANDAFQPLLDTYKRLRSRSANKRPPKGRLDHLKRLREEMTQQAKQVAKEMSEKQDAVSRAWPRWSFDDYLAHVAQLGDGDALALLQLRHKEQAALNAAFISAASDADARRIVYRHLKPYVAKNGSSVYCLPDGGKAIDRADKIYVPEVSLQAAYLAIDLGATRFGGQPLRIEGTAGSRRRSSRRQRFRAFRSRSRIETLRRRGRRRLLSERTFLTTTSCGATSGPRAARAFRRIGCLRRQIAGRSSIAAVGR